jgi:hypothetical protein
VGLGAGKAVFCRNLGAIQKIVSSTIFNYFQGVSPVLATEVIYAPYASIFFQSHEKMGLVTGNTNRYGVPKTIGEA